MTAHNSQPLTGDAAAKAAYDVYSGGIGQGGTNLYTSICIPNPVIVQFTSAALECRSMLDLLHVQLPPVKRLFIKPE